MSEQPATCDGTYAYRWHTQSGRHTVMFEVRDGLIEDSPASQRSPVKPYVGVGLKIFELARLEHDWPHKDDSLRQVLAAPTVSEE